MAGKQKLLDILKAEIDAISKSSRNTPMAVKSWKRNSPEFNRDLAREWVEETRRIQQLKRQGDLARGFGGNPAFIPNDDGSRFQAFAQFANTNPEKVRGGVGSKFLLDENGAFVEHPSSLMTYLNTIPDRTLEEWGVPGAMSHRRRLPNEVEAYGIDFLPED